MNLVSWQLKTLLKVEHCFMQLGFNWVTNKESTLILIYFGLHKGIYKQKIG